MLRKYDKAPDFILPDRAAGGQFALIDLTEHAWTLIVTVPLAEDAPSVQSFLDSAAAREEELERRRLHVVCIISPDVDLSVPGATHLLHVLTDASGTVAAQYGARGAPTCVYLVRPDGIIMDGRMENPRLDEILEQIEELGTRSAQEAEAVALL
jgi:hypothetical protein